MTDWPWSTIWAAINALAAVGAAVGAWLAFRVALAAYQAEHRPMVVLNRAHGKTSVRSIGKGAAFKVVLVGYLGTNEVNAISVAAVLAPGSEIDVSPNSVSYTISYGNAIFFSDADNHWYWTRATAESLSKADNLTFKQETFPIPTNKVPKDVMKAINSESVLDWLERQTKQIAQ